MVCERKAREFRRKKGKKKTKNASNRFREKKKRGGEENVDFLCDSFREGKTMQFSPIRNGRRSEIGGIETCGQYMGEKRETSTSTSRVKLLEKSLGPLLVRQNKKGKKKGSNWLTLLVGGRGGGGGRGRPSMSHWV